MKDEEATSRTLVEQLDAGDAHVVRRNARYARLSTRLEQLPVPLLDQGAQDQDHRVHADDHDVHAIIPWVEFDALLGVDVPLWQPWN